jgi:hypothetical protein
MAWHESWDRQQETYMPDREHRFTTVLDVLEAVNDRLLPHLAGARVAKDPVLGPLVRGYRHWPGCTQNPVKSSEIIHWVV